MPEAALEAISIPFLYRDHENPTRSGDTQIQRREGRNPTATVKR